MASATQRAKDVLAAVRRARNRERSLDTALEKVERELLRLRKRKTLIQPDDLQTLVRLWDTVFKPLVSQTEQAMADLVAIASL